MEKLNTPIITNLPRRLRLEAVFCSLIPHTHGLDIITSDFDVTTFLQFASIWNGINKTRIIIGNPAKTSSRIEEGLIPKQFKIWLFPTKWVSQDVGGKELFYITTDRISLISIHSAKGLEFDLVYLVGADRIQPKDDTRDHLIRLLYVVITRAKHRLVIPYVEESEFIVRMKACLG